MSDTQWPRYEVFIQDREGNPHRNVGSVHAVDPEMALQNARDVFVRRPQTRSIWVVPESRIVAKSQQELDEGYTTSNLEKNQDDKEIYLVFQKVCQRQSMTYVLHTGQVEASSPVEAVRKAVSMYGGEESYVWWIFPKSAVHQSSDEDIETMFSQAQDKKYRMPQDYKVATEMMELKRERE